jgi:hypothetical protein
LAKRRAQVGEAAWWRNYQQAPKRAGNLTFTAEALDGCKNRLMRIERVNEMLIAAGLDPALGGGNAITVGALNPQVLKLLYCRRDFHLARTEEILALIEDATIRFGVQHWVIEINAFQRALGRDDRMEALANKYGFRVHEHSTGINKIDETLGVASMATSFILNEIWVPWADTLAEDVFTPLLNELQRWRPNVATKKLRQDLVMSLWFLWLFWMERRHSLEVIDMSAWQRRAMPWQPMHASAMPQLLGRTA